MAEVFFVRHILKISRNIELNLSRKCFSNQIINNVKYLDGVTDKSTEIAGYMRNGRIKANIISRELYDRYYDKHVTAHCEMSSNGDVHIYVRKDSDTLYEDIVHESTHAIDMNDRFGYEETQTTQSWEYRAYVAE